jgi:RING-type zinc-finger
MPRPRRSIVVPAGYEINPANGKLRKSCTANQVRNQATGRCKNRSSRSRSGTRILNISTGSPIRRRRSRAIPAGYEMYNGRLRKSCTANQVRNPVTGRCKKRSNRSRSRVRAIPAGYEMHNGKLRKSCTANQTRDVRTGRCRKNAVARSPRRGRRSSPAKASPQGEDCPVCLDDTTLKIRGCRHPLCRTCFNGMRTANNGRPVRCPMCRGPCTGVQVMNKRQRQRTPTRRSRSSQAEDCCVCGDSTGTKVPGCKHPLCQDCLQGMRASGRTVKCPICRGPLANVKVMSKRHDGSPRKFGTKLTKIQAENRMISNKSKPAGKENETPKKSPVKRQRSRSRSRSKSPSRMRMLSRMR